MLPATPGRAAPRRVSGTLLSTRSKVRKAQPDPVKQDIENKIVRSVKVALDQAVPGMVLAEPMLGPGGSVMLPLDTVLKREHIRNMRDCGLDSIRIVSYSPPKEFHPLRGKAAVIIDDSPFIRHMFAKLLYRMGVFVAEESETAEQGMVAARKYKPHLVVMDIFLPGMDGLSAIQKLAPQLPDTKFLVISTHHKKELVIKAIKCGAHSFMAKPIRWEALKPRVLDLIGEKPEQSAMH
jgi:CheY-like chemotaxis protein